MSASSSLPARQNMLKSQILTGNVLEPRVVAALENVPREEFVPEQFSGVAYIDEEVPLGAGRYLMEPLAFARMLEHAAIGEQATVLCVGCGSGYSAAILAQIARQVIALEEDAGLAASARTKLANIPNVTLVQSALVGGVQKYAPYDVILVEGAIEYVPQPLADQLKEGGRMLAFESAGKQRIGISGLGALVEYKKIHNSLYRTVARDASVAPLMQFNKPETFVF